MESACGHRAWLLPNVACNSHGNLSNIEKQSLELQRLCAVSKSDRGELHATLLGNHIRCRTQQRAVHQHAWHRDSTQSAALHPLRSAAPLRSATPDQNGCNANRWGSPPLQQQAQTRSRPRRFSLIGNIQADQKGLNLTDRNPPQQARVRIDAHSWRPLPGRSVHEFQARTQRQNSRGQGEARTTGRYLGELHPKSHVIYLGQFLTGATNVAIATTIFQNLKG